MDVVVRNLISLQGPQRNVAGDLVAGLVEKSYVVITDHGIDLDLYEQASMRAKAFFRQPLGEKLDVDIRRSSAHRGYVPQTEIGDYEDEGGIRRYEAFDVGAELAVSEPLVQANTPLMGPNFWPDEPFKQAANDLFAALTETTDHILDLLELGFDLRPGTFSQYRTSPLSQLRFINYFDRPENAVEHVAMVRTPTTNLSR